MRLGLTMMDKLRRTEFLGRDFLTWLLYHCDKEDGIFFLDDGEKLFLTFENNLTLDGNDPVREATTVKIVDPLESEEVMLALKLGKKVGKASIFFEVNGIEYRAVVTGAPFRIKSLKCPDPMTMEGPEAFQEKAQMIETAERALNKLFIKFMEIRKDDEKWENEKEKIERWVLGKREVSSKDGQI